MNNKKYEILESLGWTVECESPFEIRHEDGSFATQQAAKIVMEEIIKENKIEQKHTSEVMIERLSLINTYIQNVVTNALEQDMHKKHTSDAHWKTVFKLVFNDQTSKVAFDILDKINNPLDYYDPDSSYQEDVIAFSNALNDKLTSLQNLTKKPSAKRM